MTYPVRATSLLAMFAFAVLVVGSTAATVQAQHTKDALQAALAPLYNRGGAAGAAPDKDNLVAALKSYLQNLGVNPESVLNDPAFAWDLMETIGELSGVKAHETLKTVKDIKLSVGAKFTPVAKARWTLRHYATAPAGATEPAYTTLKTTTELAVQDIAKTSNTQLADFNKLGNTSFVFFLICIDGQPIDRTFLKDTTHYVEIPFETVPEMFVSGDWLSATGAPPKVPVAGLRGSGADVKNALLNLATEQNIDRSHSVKFMQSMDKYFTMFEVKIPAEIKNIKWIKK